MSSARPTTPPETLRQKPSAIELNAGIYAILTLLSAFWIAITLWDAGRDYTAMIVVGLTLLLLITRVWLVGLIYFGVLAFLFMDEPPDGRTMRDLHGQELLFVAATVAFLISSSRYLALTAPILPYGGMSLGALFSNSVDFLSSLIEQDSETDKQKLESPLPSRLEARHKSTIRVDEFLTGIFRWLVALVGASLLLQFVPYGDTEEIVTYGVKIPALRASTLAWMLVGFAGVAGLLLTPIAWMRYSKLEAGVYLRSTVTKWCFGDLRAIVGRLVKNRRKSLVTNLRRGKPTRVNLMDAKGGVVRAGNAKQVRLKGRAK